NAVWWYSRDTFLYRLLNQALRKHNVELLFLFGWFIQDLYKQLTDEYEKFRTKHIDSPKLTVYRGQTMSRNEIDELASYRLAITNSFFSTTKHRQLATFYLNSLAQSDDQLQNVLFEVKIDCQVQSRSFADISHLSHFQTEDEILFMIGTLFEVGEVNYIENERLWLIHLELIYDENVQDTRNFQSSSSAKRTLKNCLSKLSTFILPEIGDNELQAIVFENLVELFPQEEKWCSAIEFKCQSEHLRLQGEEQEECQNEIVSKYEKAIAIWQEYQDDDSLNCSIELGQLYFSIGEYYSDDMHDDKIAEKYL
ncbi:unnamed protein product, partial [Adineta ricciae]